MSNPSLLIKYPKYSLISGEVVKHTDRGTTLLIEEGVFGYIPQRELAWGEKEAPQKGQRLTALVLKEDSVLRRLVVSRRLALKNPWDTAARDYPVGSMRRGKVARVMNDRVYVDLGLGIDGTVPASEIPRMPDSNSLISLWPGDHVLTKVIDVAPAQHRLILTINGVIAQRDHQIERRRYSDRSHGTSLGKLAGYLIDPLEDIDLPWYDPDGLVHRVLLLDNDSIFASNTVSWMRTMGYAADYAQTAEECLALIEKNHYDLFILDYELGSNTGINVAKIVRSQGRDTRIVLLSGQAEQRLCEGHDLERLICWGKPLGIEDFAELLEEAQQGVCRICSQAKNDNRSDDAYVRIGLEAESSTFLPLEVLARSNLKQLMAEVAAEAGIVCAIGVESKEVSILAQEGSIISLDKVDLHQLINSPASDVCLEKEVVRVDDVLRQQGRFRYLLPLGTFNSFLGVPILASRGDTALGILLFHRLYSHFTSVREQRSLVRAGFLALEIERQDVLRATLTAQQAIFAGRLAAIMAHEVRGQLSQFKSGISAIIATINELRLRGQPFTYETLVEEDEDKISVMGTIENMREASSSIGLILETQLEFARSRHRYMPEELAFDLLMEDMIVIVKLLVEGMLKEARLSEPGNMARVEIVSEIDEAIPDILTVPVLIKQVFLNLTFNAIQQLIETHNTNGEVQVLVRYVPSAPLPIKIIVIDNGPGIHASHQEQLFRRGFTTRKGGTGLGLYISKAIALALGGELQLKESFMGYGTTFEFSLPLSVKDKVDE